VKPSIVVIAALSGPAAGRIHEIQQRFDPRMAAELPPHITLIGSSGMGPISVRTPAELLRDALLPVASSTQPMSLRFAAPIRFMQSNVVVLPLDPHGPLRALHETMAARIRSAKITAERARFTFTPHCTLSLYRELPEVELRELLTVRVDDEVAIEQIQAYRATTPSKTEQLFALTLGQTQ